MKSKAGIGKVIGHNISLILQPIITSNNQLICTGYTEEQTEDSHTCTATHLIHCRYESIGMNLW